MFGFIKKLFGGKPVEATQPEAAPYKVEVAPAPVVVESAPAAPAKIKANQPSGKKPAGKKPAGQKPAVKAKSSRNRKPKSKPQA